MRYSRRLNLLLYGVLGIVVAIATAVRVAPLVEGGERLRWQCVSEDGYLMLTIARNVALGHGFSVSGGMIPSNGTQPLCSLLFALGYLCTDADRVNGLYPVVGMQFLISVLGGVLIYVLARRYLFVKDLPRSAALLAAAIWYVSPTSLRNTQNALETGLTSVLILGCIALYDALRPRLRSGFATGPCLALGSLLGITFLSRNDSCFLIAVLLGIHVITAYRRGMMRGALAQAFLIGLVSVAVSLPWLWFNVTKFGHIVPISGRAEALNVQFGSNFVVALVAILENALLVARTPGFIDRSVYFQAFSGALLSILVGIALVKRRWLAENFSAGVGVLACFVLTLFIYYSLFFGMPSFLDRYFFPVTVLSALVSVVVLFALSERLRPSLRLPMVAGIGVAAAVVCTALDVRIYLNGTGHLHSQAVEWVAANVPEDTWVAAVQTGTLGYYHTRTINLDGKVDPYALEAREEDRIPDYVIERNVEYIVDWRRVAVTWAAVPAFNRNYELVVNDARLNLGVLRRRPSVPSPEDALSGPARAGDVGHTASVERAGAGP